MGRLQNDKTPLMVTLKEGLSKYAKALVSQGNGKKKPPQSYTDAVAAVALHRREDERKGKVMFSKFFSMSVPSNTKVLASYAVFNSRNSSLYCPLFFLSGRTCAMHIKLVFMLGLNFCLH